MRVSETAMPRVSVVTINYNMAPELDATIQSVLGQNYPALEYIVMDGGSTDGSPEIIHRYGARLAHWVSERDGGVYDAMNKGAAAAAGDWVIFMNAGDRFHDSEVVADVFSVSYENADILYGHVMLRAPDGSERLILARPDALPLQMPTSHQSILARRSLLLAHPFAGDFPISADHEFLLWAEGQGARFLMLSRTIAIFTRGGISDRRRREALTQLRAMLKRHGRYTSGVALRYWLFAARALAGPVAKSLLPAPLARWMLARKLFD